MNLMDILYYVIYKTYYFDRKYIPLGFIKNTLKQMFINLNNFKEI